MKNVSNDFRKVIRAGGPFYAYAKVVFSNGEELELTSQNDFYIDGNNYTESGGDGFPLGAAVSKTIDIGIDNSDERFSDYDFYYARITMYTEADLPSGKIERIREGTFTVINSVAPGDVIEITASDDMYKADVEYVSKLSYPASALRVLQEACSQSNVNLGSVTFTNQDFQILGAPEGITCRQIFGYIAQIAGGNAVMDENNRLIIKTYNLPELDFIDIISGGFIGDSLNNKISGGIFGDNLKDYITAGKFGSNSNYAILSEFSTEPEIATDDVVITAIETTGEKDDEEVTYLYGEEGYVLAIENPLIKGAEEAAIKLIGDIVIGFRLRPFSGEFYPNPTLQFMDAVYLVDRKYNIYQTFITNHTFNYLGNSEFSNDTESPERNNSEYYSSATAAYRKAREELKRQKTEWEKAMEELKDRIDNSSGLYMTVGKQPDGSSIYYMHDKPTLKESMIVWKMTAEAFAVSSDGGETYNAGLTVDGTLITKIMNTIGINFDWGVGGTLIIQTPSGTETLYADAKTGTVRISADTLKIGGKTVQNIADESTNKLDEKLDSTQEIFNRLTQNGKLQGLYLKDNQLYVNATYIKSGTLVLGGSNNQYGKLSIKDASNKEIGRWDNNGIYVTQGTISSKSGQSGVSIRGGRFHFEYEDIDVGYMGDNSFVDYPSNRGVVFDLEDGSYMAWAARESDAAPYQVKLLYTSKSFSGYVNDRIYFECETDFENRTMHRVNIDDFNCKGSFKIVNNVDANIYSDIDMHNWSIKNVKFENIAGSGGYAVLNGNFPIVTSIQNNGNGSISWFYGNVTIRNGLITSWPS